MERRDFLELIALATALGAGGCRRPDHRIVPAVNLAEYQTEGVAEYYSSVWTHKNAAYGAVIKAREGRPVKIDGNPLHPSNLGGSSALMQASIYDLYNPSRLRRPLVNGSESTIAEVIDHMLGQIGSGMASGSKIRVLIEEHCSPTIDGLIGAIESASNLIKFVRVSSQWTNRSMAYVNKRMTGVDGVFMLDPNACDLILSIDCDFLGSGANSLYYQSNMGSRNGSERAKARIITIEAFPSITGAASARRIVLSPIYYQSFMLALLRKLSVLTGKLSNIFENIQVDENDLAGELALDLFNNRKRGFVMTGEHLPQGCHAIAVAINYILGNLELNSSFNILPFSNSSYEELKEFRDDIQSNDIGLVISLNAYQAYISTVYGAQNLDDLGGNRFIDFSHELNSNDHNNITNIPLTHWIEGWGDALAIGGNYSVRQPVIRPINKDSISVEDVLFNIVKYLKCNEVNQSSSYFDYLRDYANRIYQGQVEWDKLLADGLCKLDLPRQQINAIDLDYLAQVITNKDRYDLLDDCVLAMVNPSGSGAVCFNNPWLNELPDPISKQVWGGSAWISPELASDRGLTNGDVVEVSSDQGSISLPVIIIPGSADKCVQISIGYGNDLRYLSIINSLANVHTLVSLSTTGRRSEVILSQTHNYDILNILNFGADQNANDHQHHEYNYKSYRWAMLIDLNLCTGCGACVIACQAENNIPSVGPTEAAIGRIMHWIRIDRYFDEATGRINFLPVPCQHCEDAPCESVCPVLASTHSPDGLNETTYNRCIGSRICMANCPYKVRRFNFLDYHKNEATPLENIYNPEVTVRSRGVVEKCSFCVQKINEARLKSTNDGQERIPTDTVRTACQMACPSGAITFGDASDAQSAISKLLSKPGNCKLLNELGLNPSVSYNKKT